MIDTHEFGKLYSGTLEKNVIIRSLNTHKMFISFESGKDNTAEHKGFELSIRSFGANFVPSIPTTTEISYTDLPLEYLLQYVVIQKEKQVPETWKLLRELLLGMANKFVFDQNLPLKPFNT